MKGIGFVRRKSNVWNVRWVNLKFHKWNNLPQLLSRAQKIEQNHSTGLQGFCAFAHKSLRTSSQDYNTENTHVVQKIDMDHQN